MVLQGVVESGLEAVKVERVLREIDKSRKLKESSVTTGTPASEDPPSCPALENRHLTIPDINPLGDMLLLKMQKMRYIHESQKKKKKAFTFQLKDATNQCLSHETSSKTQRNASLCAEDVFADLVRSKQN